MLPLEFKSWTAAYRAGLQDVGLSNLESSGGPGWCLVALGRRLYHDISFSWHVISPWGVRIINWVKTLQHHMIRQQQQAEWFGDRRRKCFLAAFLCSHCRANHWVWHSVTSGKWIASDSDLIKPLPQTSIFASLDIKDISTFNKTNQSDTLH